MAKTSKRYQDILKEVDTAKVYTVKDAVDVLKKTAGVKFDESIDVSLSLGVDPKKADQQVRGTVTLPNGTGKAMNVVAICQGDAAKAAEEAGANHVGAQELLDKIKGGWTDFDVLITTPDMMREVGKLGRVLGPRGLMPSPKAGTVTTDIAKAVTEVKKGKIEFKVDKSANINNQVAKKSFDESSIVENVEYFVSAIMRAKPSTSKGQYIKSFTVSSTMGPGLKIDLSTVS